MRVVCFNEPEGIYHFETGALHADRHMHPLVEVIASSKGDFYIAAGDGAPVMANFAIIAANQPHRIQSDAEAVQLLMLESYNNLLSSFLPQNDLQPIQGLFTSTSADPLALLKVIKDFALAHELKRVGDERIAFCLTRLAEGALHHDDMLAQLTEAVHLSASRLSHLFTEQMGISLKKFLLWSRLRQAISLVLAGRHSLSESAHQAGFYDQAHFSNSFKQLLGVSPSFGYNSRTLQS